MDTKEIVKRLREAASKVRTKSYPLSDLIPLLQQAADEIEELEMYIREIGERD